MMEDLIQGIKDMEDQIKQLVLEFVNLKLLHHSGCPAHPYNEGEFINDECTCNIREVRELREKLKALMK